MVFRKPRCKPAWWQMFNWCSHMTRLEMEEQKKKKKKTRGSEIKSICLDHTQCLFLVQHKFNHIFYFSAVRCHAWSLEKKYFNALPGQYVINKKCTPTNYQILGMKHYLQKLLVNKIKYYAWWPAFLPMPEWLGDNLGEGSERGCQPDSPQVSPSNELWTSCFGRAGQQPSPPLKPAWHFHTGQGAGGP